MLSYNGKEYTVECNCFNGCWAIHPEAAGSARRNLKIKYKEAMSKMSQLALEEQEAKCVDCDYFEARGWDYNPNECVKDVNTISMVQLIEAKEALKKASNPFQYISISNASNLLGTLTGTHASTVIMDDVCNNKPQQVEPTMYFNANANLEGQTKEYLLERTSKIKNKLQETLAKQFNLYENPPISADDMLAKIKAGEYILDEKMAKHPHYGITYGIEWRTKPADMDGYNAAMEQVKGQEKATKDAIMVFSAADALKAVQTFEAWTPTAATTKN